jgi:hypothetical protein
MLLYESVWYLFPFRLLLNGIQQNQQIQLNNVLFIEPDEKLFLLYIPLFFISY